MDVSLWFDPVCPFCWMTSRWLVSVAPQRDLVIDWQPISLLLKNDPPADDDHRPTLERTHGYLRVAESLRAAGDADRIGDLYTELGRRIHHEEQTEIDVASVLAHLGLDEDHARAQDDPAFDAAIHRSMDGILALVGKDVGTPLLAFDGGRGRVGFFGPVLTDFPRGDAGLRLWDAVVTLGGTPGFSEIKHQRTGGPDPATIPTTLTRDISAPSATVDLTTSERVRS